MIAFHRFTQVTALVVVWLLCLQLQMQAEAPDKPNILLIFADDLGATDLACYGSDLHRTPNLDKLAAEGVKFTRAYTAAHVCSPTRASLLTGKTPARLHLTDYLVGHQKPYAKLMVPDWTKGLPLTETTIAKVLKSQGYATAWLGKWHAGDGAQGHGFDAGNQSWHENRKEDEVDPKGVFTLNAEAKSFIEANADKPFFVALSHYSVHGPVRFNKTLKDEYQKIIDGKPTPPVHNNAGYAAMLEALDASVGQMLEWLEKKGLGKNTLVIFYSDNGGALQFTSNKPLREGKGSLYEGGVRVPLIARWPGHLPAGVVNDTRISSIDLLPSFASLAGAAVPPGMDGKDLSVVFNSNTSIERGTLYWHYPHYHAAPPCGSILDGDYKLIEWFESGETELYNLAVDPSEANNLSASQQEKAAELLAKLKAWRQEVGAQMMAPNPNYDPARANEGPPKKEKKGKEKSGKRKEKSEKAA